MPVRSIRPLPVALVGTIALLAGCARHQPPQTAAAAPVGDVPPRPTLPAGYGAVNPPPRDTQGDYRTINSGLDAQATIWHVRAALNVAAIGCREPAAAGIVPAYNAMLVSKKAVLARAQKSVQAALQASVGKDWQAADDSAMTRLYNYFAMPAAKPAFCAEAARIAPEAATAAPAQFDAFAAATLARLDAPFTAVYRTVDDYRVEVARWDERYGPGAVPAPSAVAATERAPAPRPPKLAYAKLDDVIAWTPRKGPALAAR